MYISLEKSLPPTITLSHTPDETLLENSDNIVVIYGDFRLDGHGNKEVCDELSSSFTHQILSKYARGGYFAVLYSKSTGDLSIIRDVSGLRTGYYHFDTVAMRWNISTSMHSIAKRVDTDLSELYTDFLLYQEFVPDGFTIYNNISEVRSGEIIRFSASSSSITSEQTPLPISFEENDLSLEENITTMRRMTIDVHSKLVTDDNVVYLSGGIDSNVIMASLKEICPDKISAVSYRIKGTDQDETSYALRLAESYGTPCQVVEVDPADKTLAEEFENFVQNSNNPYIGSWVFRPIHFSGRETTRYFAGHDTRLHTPSANNYDEKVFSRIAAGKDYYFGKGLSRSLNRVTDSLYYGLGLYKSQKPQLKYSYLVASMVDSSEYVMKKRYFADKVRYRKEGFKLGSFDDIAAWYRTDFTGRDTTRAVYNTVVEKKWQEQYLDDMLYLTDMAHAENVITHLPFYDSELSRFSSTIPWKLATMKMEGVDGFSGRKVSVDKYVLRKAFEKDLPWELMARKKAVSVANHLLMNGELGSKIKEVITADISSRESFVKRFGHVTEASHILSKNEWSASDHRLIVMSVYLSALCIYYKHNVVG